MGGVVRSKSASASHQYPEQHCQLVANQGRRSPAELQIANSKIPISVDALSDKPSSRRFRWTEKGERRKGGGCLCCVWVCVGVGAEDLRY